MKKRTEDVAYVLIGIERGIARHKLLGVYPATPRGLGSVRRAVTAYTRDLHKSYSRFYVEAWRGSEHTTIEITEPADVTEAVTVGSDEPRGHPSNDTKDAADAEGST